MAADVSKVSAKELFEKLSLDQKINLYNKYALNVQGSFSYHEGDSYRLNKQTKLVEDPATVETLMLSNAIAVSDFFIAQAIASLGVADGESIKRYMVWAAKKNPGKVIPHNISDTVLKDRLENLAQCGIVRSFSIVSAGTKRGTFYSVSELGAAAIKRVLDLNTMPFDRWAMLDGEHRIFRRLVTTMVSSYLFNSPATLTANFHSELYDKQRESRFNVYGQISASYENGEKPVKELIIMEPVLFGTNPTVRSEQEVLDDIKDRMSALAVKVSSIIEPTDGSKIKYDGCKVVFVVQDFESMKKVTSMVMNASVKLLENAFFTTERLVSMNDGKLSRSFYNVEMKDGNPSIQLANYPCLFGEDDGADAKLVPKNLVQLGLAGVDDSK